MEEGKIVVKVAWKMKVIQAVTLTIDFLRMVTMIHINQWA